jgi:bifunctional non-homologous end joining protein LigD
LDPPNKPHRAPVTHKDLAVPTLAKRPFSREGWLYELKYDGFRALAIKQGERVTLVSRKGTDLLRAFPEIYPALAVLPDLVLDGELVLLDEYGRPDFHRLCRRFRLKRQYNIDRASIDEPAAIFAFDLLWLEGKDMRSDPLRVRKATLKQVLKGSARILFTQHIEDHGEKLFKEAGKLGLEGIVAKRATSTYPRGRTTEWLKIKTGHGRHADEERKKWNE